MADNLRAPIRLSDIDNLLEDSIFETSNGAKLVEYMKTRRTGGRMRLQNIFEQVAAQVRRPRFNLKANTSDPQPLPDSPNELEEPQNDDEMAGPSTPPEPTPDVNTDARGTDAAEPIMPPSVEQNNIPVADSKASRKSSARSPAVSLAREAMINQYHRTNAAKCNILKQLTSSTPKVDSHDALNRISTFTTSISPIVEFNDSPIIESQPVERTPAALPVAIAPVPNDSPGPPVIRQFLEPVAVAEPQTPVKVIVQAVDPHDAEVVVQLAPELENAYPLPPDVIIPETPSPVKIMDESPRLPHPPIQPRRLTATFIDMENAENHDAENSDVMTSDESDPVNQNEQVEQIYVSPALDVSLPKSILKDADVSLRKRTSFRVSFSERLVEQREISPAPSIPEAHYSSCSDDSNESDIDEDEFEVVDEVYSDDSAEYGNGVDEQYNEDEQMQRNVNQNYVAISERPGSPLLNVVDEEPVQWLGTTTPGIDGEKTSHLLPTTHKKYDKTNLQLVDIITDWDDEEDDDNSEEESEKSPEEIPETQPTNTTNRQAVEITSSNMEESAVRLIDIPSPPKHVPLEPQQDEEEDMPLSPPPQFTDSAKKRFVAANDEAVLSRLHSELTNSQSPTPTNGYTELADGSYEKIPETLVEIAQSLRDPPPVSEKNAETVADSGHRITVLPKKKGNKKKQPVDPATESYFKNLQETFARPVSPVESALTAPKRKLYAAKPKSQSPDPKSLPNTINGHGNEHMIRDMCVVIEKLSFPFDANVVEIKEEIEDVVETDQTEKAPTSSTEEPPAVVETNSADSENSKPRRKNGITKKTRYKGKEKDDGVMQIEQNEQAKDEPEEKRETRKSKRTQQPNPAAEAVTVEQEPAMEAADVVEQNSSSPKPSTRSQKHKTNTESGSVENGEEQQRQDCAKTASSGPAPKPSKRGKSKKKAVCFDATPESQTEELASAEKQPTVDQGFAETTTSTDAANTSMETVVSEAASSTCYSEQASNENSAESNSDLHSDLAEDGNRVRLSEDEEFAGFETVVALQPERKRHTRKKSSKAAREKPASPIRSDPVVATTDTSQPTDEEIPESTQQRAVKSVSKSRKKVQSANLDPPAPVQSPVSVEDGENATQLPLKKRKIRDSDASSEFNSTEERTVVISLEALPIEDILSGGKSTVPLDNVALGTKVRGKDRPKTRASKEDKEKVVSEDKPEKPKPISRYLRDYDDDMDKTWVPSGTKMLKEKTNKLRRNLGRNRRGSNSDSTETEQPARKSNRNCRLASLILLTNPFIKSASQKPNYRPMSLEEMLEAEYLAKEMARKEKQRGKKKPAAGSNPVGQKRTKQHPPENQSHAKKTRRDAVDAVEPVTDSNSESSGGDTSQEKEDIQGWMTKLIYGTHREESLPAGPGAGETIHFKLNDLSFQERNGIQYSFFAYSERENCGFLRFAPEAYKKKTLTTNFQLKFLMLSGQLHFIINGKDALAKAGEFVIIPEDSKYSIKNGEEISLVFMIKVLSIAGQLSLDTMQTSPSSERIEYTLEK